MPESSSPNTGRPLPSMATSELSPEKQSILWPEETLALSGPVQGVGDLPVVPTSPDGSLPWPDDSARDGWSARMFLHQMLATSRPGWKRLDTESLLSRLTLATLPVRVGGGNSLSAALLSCTPDSPELYATPPMILGLARRAVKRRRPLQHVLLRTPAGWRRKTLTVSSRDGGYAFSLPKSVKVFKDSPEAGLLDFLEAAAASCAGTR